MDTAVKRSNKENSKPEGGLKKTESRNVLSKHKPMRPLLLRSKNESKEEKAGDKNGSKAQVKASKPAKSNNSDPTQRKTVSQAFRSEQTLRQRKMVLETQKPPSFVLSKPLLPGIYKGRVVQSKIDCFRKPPSSREKIPCEDKTKAELVVRSKSTTALSASSTAGVQDGVESRAKSVSQRRILTRTPAQTSTVSTKPSTVSTKPSTVSTKPSTVSTKPSTVSTKPSTVSTKPSTVSTKPSTVSTKPSTVSTKPSTVSTKPSTVSTKPSTVSTKPSVISRKPVTMSARPPTVTSFIKKNEVLKPTAAASEQKPQRSVSSSIGQYRIRMESAEERRLKLAEWLASKGKTLKRPPMTEKSAPQTCKPCAKDEAQADAGKRAEVVPVRETEQSEVPQREPAFSSSPSHILNITLDLLDNSDAEPPAESEIRMESLVMNLCERLEAMQTPSSCSSQTKSEENEVLKVEEETLGYEILEEEELSAELSNGVEKHEEEDGDEEEEKKTIEVKAEGEGKLFAENEEENIYSTPADVLDACVVKYSVKTTAFLQSVKKRMESELVPGTPGSQRKSSIKDLKFLTPVRRSSRIHKNSSRLPGMLTEHDPCVSSLAELGMLDAADSNAYIYRKNPALLQHLPDQRPEAPSSEHTCK